MDFHPQSTSGRYDPIGKTWVVDGLDSPLIDFGDPLEPSGQEPPPNGGHLNVGIYGNTPQASKSRVAPWLLVS